MPFHENLVCIGPVWAKTCLLLFNSAIHGISKSIQDGCTEHLLWDWRQCNSVSVVAVLQISIFRHLIMRYSPSQIKLKRCIRISILSSPVAISTSAVICFSSGDLLFFSLSLHSLSISRVIYSQWALLHVPLWHHLLHCHLVLQK